MCACALFVSVCYLSSVCWVKIKLKINILSRISMRVVCPFNSIEWCHLLPVGTVRSTIAQPFSSLLGSGDGESAGHRAPEVSLSPASRPWRGALAKSELESVSRVIYVRTPSRFVEPSGAREIRFERQSFSRKSVQGTHLILPYRGGGTM